MIDEAAKAMRRFYVYPGPGLDWSVCDVTDESFEITFHISDDAYAYCERKNFEAALKAIREPSEEMIRATHRINPCISDAGQCYSEEEIWRATIGVLIKECGGGDVV